MTKSYTAVCVESSPNHNLKLLSWLGVLVTPHREEKTVNVVPEEQAAQARPSSRSEPEPQTADPLIAYWKDKNCSAEPNVTETSTQRSLKRTSLQSTKVLPQISRELAERSINAHHTKDATEKEFVFWSNRLRLLQREVEIAQKNSASSTTSRGSSEASHSFVSEAINSQLEDERRRVEALRRERLKANKILRESHAKALRETHRAILESKREASNRIKQERAEAQLFVEEVRSKELHKRSQLKETIQHEKVVMLLKRARDKAMRFEETRSIYEQRIQQIEKEEEEQQRLTSQLIQQSSKLVQKLRHLKESNANSFDEL